MLPAEHNEPGANLALGWLVLATAAVAASSLFAILIVMARVPGLGALFPGNEFYRVALTLHVDLSQWVWFMAFAATLWSLAARNRPAAWHWLALVLAALGAVMMAVSPALGAIRPLMSNYVPVLDSPWFLAGLGVYGLAVLLVALAVVREAGAGAIRRVVSADSLPELTDLGLWLAALVVLTALAVLMATWLLMPDGLAGLAFFETLFWGAGHIWQFCLTTLMLIAWIGLSAAQIRLPACRWLRILIVAGAVPALLAPLLLLYGPTSPEHFTAFTRLMQWTSWQIPLGLGGVLLLRHWRARIRPATGLSLSMLLLVCGVILGALIDGQTTLVTAHYHGTIGAVTLSFMGLTYGVLSRLGCAMPARGSIDWQLRLYGNGILMMMAGLAGAGLMGAPRKMAGNVGIEFSVETLSRMVLGLGGTLATIGILMFLVLVLRQLWPGVSLRVLRHG
ncbi:MAG: cbb3-type cytochrome c oxidase subunit I [Rhodocyclales bacterium]|nr:cbb3-type cytochrome c oxidase subunit I [Rhodocyclales bacterium]